MLKLVAVPVHASTSSTMSANPSHCPTRSAGIALHQIDAWSAVKFVAEVRKMGSADPVEPSPTSDAGVWRIESKPQRPAPAR